MSAAIYVQGCYEAQGHDEKPFRLCFEHLDAGVVHRLRLSLDRTWRSRRGDDPTRMGIQLRAVTVETAADSSSHPAGRWEEKPPRRALEATADSFRVATDVTRASVTLDENGRRNVAEREGTETELRSTPAKVYVEVAWLCHLRWQLFPGAAQVWFNGNGETLLHPCAAETLASVREFEFLPSLLTSGACFTPRNMRLLVESGFFLSISVDSRPERDFERLRRGAKFSKVVEAIDHLQELARRKREGGSISGSSVWPSDPTFISWGISSSGRPTTASQRSSSDLFTTLAPFRRRSRRRVRVRPYPLLPPVDSGRAAHFEEVVDENLRRTENDRYGEHSHYIAEHPSNTHGNRCGLAWSECFVGVDGTLTPCDMYTEKLAVGNLHDADFLALWNAPKMQELRRTVNGSNPEGLCRFGVCMFRPRRMHAAPPGT